MPSHTSMFSQCQGTALTLVLVFLIFCQNLLIGYAMPKGRTILNYYIEHCF